VIYFYWEGLLGRSTTCAPKVGPPAKPAFLQAATQRLPLDQGFTDQGISGKIRIGALRCRGTDPPQPSLVFAESSDGPRAGARLRASVSAAKGAV